VYPSRRRTTSLNNAAPSCGGTTDTLLKVRPHSDTVRTTAIIILGLLAASIGSQSQSAEKRYTGTMVVASLGKIAFPEGEWALRFQRIQHPTNSVLIPDYFVFKRIGDRLERLTFLRHPPPTTPRQLALMMDTVGETMGDGLPWEEKKKEDRSGGEIHSMRVEPPSPALTERTIAFSFIHVRPSPASSWLCHSFLFSHDGSVFVIVHASTSVISPETVGDVKLRSQFFPNDRPARGFK